MAGLILAGIVGVEHDERLVRCDCRIHFVRGGIAQHETLWRLVAAIAPGRSIEVKLVRRLVASLVVHIAVGGLAWRIDARRVVHLVRKPHWLAHVPLLRYKCEMKLSAASPLIDGATLQLGQP